MRDTRYAQVTLGTSTVLAACGLALLLASYVWMATMLPRVIGAEIPSPVRLGLARL